MTFGNLESDLGFTGPLTAIYSNASSLPENALQSFIGRFRVQISADAYFLTHSLSLAPPTTTDETVFVIRDPASDKGLSQTSEHQQEHFASHSETFLRDGASGSGCRPVDDQSLIGPRQLLHDDGLSALSSRALDQHPQSAGLAASQTTADLSTTSGERATVAGQAITAKLSVAQILRQGAAAYVRQHADSGACGVVQSTLAKLTLCRTPVLGGNEYACDSCGETAQVPHSCGDRHCPICSGRKRFDFAQRAEQLLLDGVTYYQVVFTLPSELSELALVNREAITDLLFTSAWKSLRKTIRGEQGYDPAAMMVLHTWNQRMNSHWHVHALVPGGGPSLSAPEAWKQSVAPELTDTCTADQVVRYLTRYLTGGPISDSRIVAADKHQVTFLAREGRVTGGERVQVPVTVSTPKFIQDWCMHIQPSQLTKTRYSGGWSSRRRTQYVEHCQELHGSTDFDPVVIEAMDDTAASKLAQVDLVNTADAKSDKPAAPSCPRCEDQPMRLTSQTPKPSWSEILRHTDPRCPAWYAQREKESWIKFLDAEYGIDYETWCLENPIESAIVNSNSANDSQHRQTPSSHQLYFAGLEPERYYLLESFEAVDTVAV